MWLAALVVLLVICLFLYLDTIKPKNFPPGPKWIPIFGCAIEIYKLREKSGYLYKTVKELSDKYCKNGPVLGIRIGKDRMAMVNTLEANKEMLFNEDIDGRPKGIFYQTRTWGMRRGVLLTDGELWKEQRRFLLKHLKEFGFGRRGMANIAQLEAIHMVKDVMSQINLNNNGSGNIQMHNFFNTYILNTLWTMMAGLRYEASDPQMQVLQAMLFDLFKAIDMVGTAFSHFPILSIIAPTASGYKDFMRIHKRIWRFLREEIGRHKENFDPEKEDKDFMDVYLRVLKENGEVESYSEGQLVAMCMDMFMAGTETTSKSMSFCFSYMVREQHVQRKAQEEIDRVVGRDRMPCLDDRVNLPYNEAVVYECIRHFMGRTFGVPHRALKNTTLAGYFIPEDTMVVSNFTNILMDENMYPDPMAFNPERFLSDGKLCLPDYYFPFGLARHRCMGEVLAKCNIFVFTTTMLQRFSFLPVPGEPPSLDHVDGVTPSAAPFKAVVLRRM
ncbi:probable cytochrome P450 303a1 [Pectinophora gossypiella]|uniref:probable cytochrome P450 303a1 n=1 Tax=Pectinophora gossypiella TaxID=13191 RepID=UPI00214EEC80|nr:probable cytochrome P450 303a1 [Pectinophora gossypiella]